MGNVIDTITSLYNQSQLPEPARNVLNDHARDGHEGDALELSFKEIHDSMIPELCEWLIKLEGKVKVLNLNINRITSQGASKLFDTLRMSNSSINRICLSNNQRIDDDCINSLGEYIKSNKFFESITLSEGAISDAGIKLLEPYLEGNTTFKCLFLLGNEKITDKSIPILLKMIESSHIDDLVVINTSITQKNFLTYPLSCNVLKYQSEILLLYTTDVNDDDIMKICDMMKKYGIDKLNKIELSENRLTSKGASVLFDTLKECNSFVLFLNLTANQLDDECMKQLGEYVQNNEYLEDLRIGKNNITDRGIEILSELFIGNVKLKKLYLIENQGITATSVPYFIEMAKNTYITEMDTWSTLVSEGNMQDIRNALLIPIDKRDIPIKSNTKSAAKISASR